MKAQNKPNSGFLGNWIPRILSFLLALFIVMAVRFLNVTDRVVHIPLEVMLLENSQYSPLSLIPDSIDAVITGDDSIVYLIDPSQIRAYVDFTDVDSDGIARKPVVLEYNQNIYKENSITVEARPSTIRILFEEVAVN